MAKPLIPAAGSSSLSSAKPTQRRLASQSPRRTSANTPRRRPTRRPSPSSGVLSLLSALCASSVSVDGRPLDAQPTALPFLYPFIHPESRDDGLDSAPADAPASPPSVPPSALPSFPSAPSSSLENRSSVADKYMPGTDGLWHKLDEWSLYGSTVCSGSCPTPSGPSTSDVDDEAATDTNSPIPSSSASPLDLDSLPSGWKPSDSSERDLTAVILALSLVLAVLIIGLMASCVMWRRKRRRLRQKDLERRARDRSAAEESDEDDDSLRQAKATQRKWAKATSRWRANIRYSARRRRTIRMSSHTTTSQEAVGPSESESTFVDHQNRSSQRSTSRTSTQRAPAAVLPDAVSPTGSTSGLSALPHSSGDADPASAVPDTGTLSSASTVETSHHPPAYHPSTHDPPQPPSALIYDATPSYDAPTEPIPSSSKLPISHPPSSDMYAEDHSDIHDITSHVGHVATDDKELLARRAALASAPPADQDAASFPHAHASASVPPIDEYELSDLPPSHSSSRPPSPYPTEIQPPYPPSHLTLPPPPSKGKMAAPGYDEYPYSFEQDLSIIDAEPEPGPSAPPFNEFDSAPPFEPVLSLTPSAPPLSEDEDDLYASQDVIGPTAPPWDDEPPSDDAQITSVPPPEPVPVPPPLTVSSSEQEMEHGILHGDRPP